MTRIAITAGILVLGAGLLWRFPLFHVVPLGHAASQEDGETFNAKDRAEEYWRARIAPHLADAHDVTTVLAELAAHPEQARSRFGRTVGIGRSTFFLLRGEGTIVSVDKNRIGVALSDGVSGPDLLITTGPVFGNAVRDTTGAITAGEFSRSSDFNDLAAELNLLVENRVERPFAKQAKFGRRVRFVGCTEMQGKATKPLKLIPLEAVLQ
jgi:predicted lipoprotein